MGWATTGDQYNAPQCTLVAVASLELERKKGKLSVFYNVGYSCWLIRGVQVCLLSVLLLLPCFIFPLGFFHPKGNSSSFSRSSILELLKVSKHQQNAGEPHAQPSI